MGIPIGKHRNRHKHSDPKHPQARAHITAVEQIAQVHDGGKYQRIGSVSASLSGANAKTSSRYRIGKRSNEEVRGQPKKKWVFGDQDPPLPCQHHGKYEPQADGDFIQIPNPPQKSQGVHRKISRRLKCRQRTGNPRVLNIA